jgi:valyl-tRNA synthetase
MYWIPGSHRGCGQRLFFDPSIVKNGFANANADLKYYYPTNDLVTAPEIMFFWVARMIISGYEYTGKLPFKNVYYTGIVRDKLGTQDV